MNKTMEILHNRAQDPMDIDFGYYGNLGIDILLALVIGAILFMFIMEVIQKD